MKGLLYSDSGSSISLSTCISSPSGCGEKRAQHQRRPASSSGAEQGSTAGRPRSSSPVGTLPRSSLGGATFPGGLLQVVSAELLPTPLLASRSGSPTIPQGPGTALP